MQVYIKTDGTVEITLTRDQFDTLRGMVDDFSVDHPDVARELDVKEVIDFITDDEGYNYQITEEIYEATEGFISGLMDYYKGAEGVNEELIRHIVANATLEKGE